ncbi:MAG: hypothetical protein DMG52_28270 [Acidobacteria bacterium]|nr:MAG: hypothetical protein DMG52_28270 [Acidobacteriota bacterium]
MVSQINVKTKQKTMDHSGSSFDSFLKQQGIREEVEAVAIKSVLARQLDQAVRNQPRRNKR